MHPKSLHDLQCNDVKTLDMKRMFQNWFTSIVGKMIKNLSAHAQQTKKELCCVEDEYCNTTNKGLSSVTATVLGLSETERLNSIVISVLGRCGDNVQQECFPKPKGIALL